MAGIQAGVREVKPTGRCELPYVADLEKKKEKKKEKRVRLIGVC